MLQPGPLLGKRCKLYIIDYLALYAIIQNRAFSQDHPVPSG